MGKYVFIYHDMGDAENSGDMEAWTSWFGKLGNKLVDGGNPFAPGAKAVTKSGTMPAKDMPATGYSIVSANSMDEAVELTKDCPLLKSDKAAVLVYEALPM